MFNTHEVKLTLTEAASPIMICHTLKHILNTYFNKHTLDHLDIRKILFEIYNSIKEERYPQIFICDSCFHLMSPDYDGDRTYCTNPTCDHETDIALDGTLV